MILSIAYFTVYFLLQLWLLYRWSRPRQTVSSATFEPEVAVLLAVRNEELALDRCLDSLARLDYPPEKLQVLIGDDRSTDGTAALVQAFIREHPNFQLITVSENLGNARAKANVIAQLSRLATAPFLFITDADMRVPPTWIRTMLAPMLNERVGVVTGTTTIEGNGWFEKVQALDWVYSLSLIQLITDLGRPVTALGNNMMLRRTAYLETGGFEHIPHSITEDVQIFQHITRQGWKFANLFQPEVLGFSLPAPHVGTVLQQRKRWMTGSMHLPWYMIGIFTLHASFYVVLLTSFYYLSMGAMLSMAAAKLLLQTLLNRQSLQRLRLTGLLRYSLLFELYLLFLSVVLIPFYFLPIRINWKGRAYRK